MLIFKRGTNTSGSMINFDSFEGGKLFCWEGKQGTTEHIFRNQWEIQVRERLQVASILLVGKMNKGICEGGFFSRVASRLP